MKGRMIAMLYDLFSDFFDDFDKNFGVFVSSPSFSDKVCPSCGMTLSEFSKKGKLGCDKCYDAFRPYLADVLKSIHGNAEHTGKISKNADAKIRLRREIDSLSKELEKAVAAQNFEEAASLRDKINALKKEVE